MRYFKIVRLGCTSSKICDVYIKFYTILKTIGYLYWKYLDILYNFLIHRYIYIERKITSLNKYFLFSFIIRRKRIEFIIRIEKDIESDRKQMLLRITNTSTSSVYAF